MSGSLFSRDWYRVAALKPALKRLVAVHPHRYRSQRWFVLQDRTSGQIRRLRPEAWRLVGLMDGEHTLQQIWQKGSQLLGERLPSHEELLQLVSNLYQANLISLNVPGDVQELLYRRDEQRAKRWLGRLKSPLSVQIPLFDPERFVSATARHVAPMFSAAAAVLWVLLLIFLVVQTGIHWQALTGNLADRVLAADNLVLLFIIYPVIKLIHEMGHAYAVKRGGGEVHELGIMLLVFFPMPYVDASATAAFAARRRRMLVGAIGMMLELAIAAVAMLIWLNAEPGLLRSMAFNVLFIAGISALLFNGNPLLRFDAYYLLADYLEIPNLAQRANLYWAYLAKRYLFGMRQLPPYSDDLKERAWLVGYGLASFVYRLFVSITIVLFVAEAYPQIGMLIGVWTLTTVWLWPIGKVLAKPFTEQEFQARGRSPWLIYGLAGALGVGLLGVLPVPLTTTVEGVVVPREHVQVVLDERCEVEQVVVVPLQRVSAGEPLLQCAATELSTTVRVLQAEQQGLAAQRRAAFDDAVRLKVIDEELLRLEQEIALMNQRIEHLTVRAPQSGTAMLPGARDLPGRHLLRGAVIGQIMGPDAAAVRVMIPESVIDLVRYRTQAVALRLAGALDEEMPVTAYQISPGAATNLVSPVLTAAAGGTVMLDTDGETTLGRYFVAMVDLPAGFTAPRYEERVFVTFHHVDEPIILRVARSIRRTFLDVFNV